MKNLLLVFAAAITFASCQKQASNELASVNQEEQTAKGGKKNKLSIERLSLIANDTLVNTPQKLLVVNSFEISNPGAGTVGFDNPPTSAGDDFRWTFIEPGTLVDDTTFIKTIDGTTIYAGITINQTSWIAATGNPVNPYVNGNGQIAFVVPSGTYACRVVNIVFGADGQEREYHSFVRPGFQF